MKKKVVFRLLSGVLLLFLTASAWGLDYDKYKMHKFGGDLWEESDRTPAIPQTINNYPTTIKFIFIQSIQNLPVLIYNEKTSGQTSVKTEKQAKNSTITVKEQDER